MKLSLAFLVLLVGCASQSQVKPQLVEATSADRGVLTTIPFTVHDNRLLVNVFLNGQGPFVMIFDSGGTSSLTPEVQKTLDLKSQGLEFGGGAGEQRLLIHSVHLKNVQVGDFKLTDQKFSVINYAPIRRSFRFPHLDGVIGFELLKQARVRIDFDRQVIQLLAPEAPSLASADTVKFDFVGRDPIIEGMINDKPAKILLDTGDRSNLTLFRKFAATSQLEDLFAQREALLTGMGVGGPIQGKLANVQKVTLGPVEVDDVLTRLPLTKRGYFYSTDISASAGMGILKGFNLEFDYKKQVVAFQKRKDFKESSTFVPVPVR